MAALLANAAGAFSGPPSGWTAVVGDERVSFQHEGTWACALLLVQARRSGSPINLRRPDVVFMPGMVGPDGAIQPIDHLILEPPWRRPKTPFHSESAYEDSEAYFPSTDTDTGADEDDANTGGDGGARGETNAVGGADPGDPAGHSSLDPGPGPNLPGTGIAPSIFQQLRAQPYARAEALRRLRIDFCNDTPAAFITPNETLTDTDERSSRPGDPGIAARDGTTGVAFNLADLTPQDSEHCDAADAGSHKHLGGPQDHGLNSTIQLLYQANSLKVAELDAASAFFCAPAQMIRKGLILSGTCQSLALPQLAFIFQFLNKGLHGRCQPQGQLLGDVTGKTYATMGLIAVIRLLVLSQSHVLKWPEQHNAPGCANNAPCPAGNPFGIQCVCVSGSLGNRYLPRVLGGPFMILCPPSSVDLWVAASAGYFLPEVAPRGSQQKEAFAELVSWRGGRLVSHQLPRSNDECLDAVTTYKPFPPSQLMVSVTADTRELPAYAVQQAFSEPSYADAVRRLRDDYGVVFKPDLDKARSADQSRYILVMSSSVFSQGKTLTDIFRVPVSLHHPSRRSTAHVWFPFPSLWTMFVYDGVHKAEGSQLWKRLMDLHKLTGSSSRCTQWCFLGVDALLNRPDDIQAMCRVLFHRQQHVDAVSEALKGYTARFLKLQALPSTARDTEMLKAGFGVEFAKYVEPIIIARDNSSPILNVTVADIDRGYSKVVKTISNPPELLSDIETLGDKCRQACSCAGVSTNTKLEALTRVPEFVTYYCAEIMPGLATGLLYSGEEYPCSPEEIERDVEKGSEGVIHRSAHLHAGHGWLDEILAILATAYNDRGPGAFERTKHILIVAATPVLTAHLAAILGSQQVLEGMAVIHRVSLGDPESARRQNARL